MSTKTIADLTSWLATVIAFVFACVGIFSQPPVFESSRPKLPTQENTPKTSGQQPPSRRLAQSWDDPYVVFKPTEDLPQNSENQNHKSPALLLIVLTGMSDYQIDSETRLRNRYAIQSALRDSDYIPEASGELNAASVQLKSGNETLTFQVPTLRPTWMPFTGTQLRSVHKESDRRDVVPVGDRRYFSTRGRNEYRRFAQTSHFRRRPG
jgi:hypothetical protein